MLKHATLHKAEHEIEHEGGDSRCYRLIFVLILTVNLRGRTKRRQVCDAGADVYPLLACNCYTLDVMDYRKYCGER